MGLRCRALLVVIVVGWVASARVAMADPMCESALAGTVCVEWSLTIAVGFALIGMVIAVPAASLLLFRCRRAPEANLTGRGLALVALTGVAFAFLLQVLFVQALSFIVVIVIICIAQVLVGVASAPTSRRGAAKRAGARYLSTT
jgi:hypothetical protein